MYNINNAGGGGGGGPFMYLVLIHMPGESYIDHSGLFCCEVILIERKAMMMEKN